MAFSPRFLVSALVVAVFAGCAHSHRPVPKQAPSSTTLLTAQDIENAPAMSLEQLLMSRVPGLTVTRASDGHLVVHLRGTTTLMGDQEPLFVVNGIAMEPSASGNLSAINPYDIETIEVLRDAASTAMYGARGANGVIVIKTKRSE